MIPILAQAAGFGIIHWLMIAVVVIAVVAIFAAFVRYSGITIPPLFTTVFWIVVGAIFVLAAIKIVVSML